MCILISLGVGRSLILRISKCRVYMPKECVFVTFTYITPLKWPEIYVDLSYIHCICCCRYRHLSLLGALEHVEPQLCLHTLLCHTVRLPRTCQWRLDHRSIDLWTWQIRGLPAFRQGRLIPILPRAAIQGRANIMIAQLDSWSTLTLMVVSWFMLIHWLILIAHPQPFLILRFKAPILHNATQIFAMLQEGCPMTIALKYLSTSPNQLLTYNKRCINLWDHNLITTFPLLQSETSSNQLRRSLQGNPRPPDLKNWNWRVFPAT